jgi:hypothetical protein
MKRFFYIMILVALVGCHKKEHHLHPAIYTITFEGEEWNEVIATNPSSFDFMTQNYVWKDATTSLTSRPKFTTSEWGSFYGGGCTVSNYGSGDLKAKGSYAYDLYVYKEGVEDSRKGCGANGSDNFLVFYGNYDESLAGEEDCRTEIYFRDGKTRYIQFCDINATTYFNNIVLNGNEFSPKLKPGEQIVVSATGFDANGNETATVEFVLASGSQTTKEWTLWDLSPLGGVVKVRFNILGGHSDDHGMTTPKYFAIDNIQLAWEEVVEI